MEKVQVRIPKIMKYDKAQIDKIIKEAIVGIEAKTKELKERKKCNG